MVYKVSPKKKPAKGGEEQRQSEAYKRMSPEEKRKYSMKKRMERMMENSRLMPAKANKGGRINKKKGGRVR